MGSYLNSCLFALEMDFFNQNEQSSCSHIIRKKSDVFAPSAIPGMWSGGIISLRQAIENAVQTAGCEKLDVTDWQYQHLERVDIIFQNLETSGPSYLQHLHWSVFSGLSVCSVELNTEFVRNEAVYEDPENINSYAYETSRKMIDENLTSYEDERTQGCRAVMFAKDYPPAEIQARYTAICGQSENECNAVLETDPNYLMSGTALMKYIGSAVDIVLPDGITELAAECFIGNETLQSIVIPEGVETIGSRAFQRCSDLLSVTLPQSLKTLGEYAFEGCSKLEKIILGRELKSIDGGMFYNCRKLKDITLPDGIKTIGYNAFRNCRELKKLIIPSGVTTIESLAFISCVSLETLYIPSSVTEIMDDFFGTPTFKACKKLTIHCVAGSAAEQYALSHGIPYVTDMPL